MPPPVEPAEALHFRGRPRGRPPENVSCRAQRMAATSVYDRTEEEPSGVQYGERQNRPSIDGLTADGRGQIVERITVTLPIYPYAVSVLCTTKPRCS